MRTRARLWVDDQRQAPGEDWRTAKTVLEAIKILADFEVSEISLDYDLAWDEGGSDKNWRETRTGMGIVKFMLDHDRVPDIVRIHSANRDGKALMRLVLESAGVRVS